MLRRFSLVCAALAGVAAAGCSGGGYLNSPGSGAVTPAPVATATAAPPATASLTLAAAGAMPAVGSAGTFALSLAALTSGKQTIAGAYLHPVTLTTNDAADLTFAVTDPSGASTANGASATIVDSTAGIVVNYDGAAVPAGTQISASTPGAPTVTLPFTP